MEQSEFDGSVRYLVHSLSQVAPEQRWGSVLHLLDYGEEEEAMDVLIATVVRFGVPVTVGQREVLAKLMNEFDSNEATRRCYRYLSDPEMLDRMIVAKGPTP